MKRDISATNPTAAKPIVVASLNEMMQVLIRTSIFFFVISSTGTYASLEYCLVRVRGIVGATTALVFTVVGVAAFAVLVPYVAILVVVVVVAAVVVAVVVVVVGLVVVVVVVVVVVDVVLVFAASVVNNDVVDSSG